MDGPLAPHLSREAAGLSRLTLRGGAAPFRLNGYFCNVIFCSQMRWLEQTVTLSSDEGAAAPGARALDQPGAKRRPQAHAPSAGPERVPELQPLQWDQPAGLGLGTPPRHLDAVFLLGSRAGKPI